MMKEKVCLITGATHGIGKATALALAQMGATVAIVGRDEARCAAVVNEIQQKSGNLAIEGWAADLSLMSEVRRFAAQFQVVHPRLHVLINNVGGGFAARQVTPEGFEKTFALNYLGQFLLTNLLLDTLKSSAPARIVNVSSRGHTMAKLDFDDLQMEKNYKAFSAYGRTKLADVMFTYELARRLSGTGVTVNALNPGEVKTDFERKLNLGLMVHLFVQIWGLNPDEGARTSVYLASSPDVEGITGKYFYKCQPIESSAESCDSAQWGRLWAVTERMLATTEPQIRSSLQGQAILSV